MAQSQLFKFGNSVILIQDDAFVDGYYNGLTGHPDSEQPVTVEAVRQIITEAITDVSKPENWNTGYILGAIEGIYIGFRRRDEPDVPQVYFGPVTLHLNRWHFREGYYTGQQNYEAGRQTRTTPERLTARELLGYIAHRDPATQTYYFGQEELSAIEDVIGQLIGYLCAALFPKSVRVHETEPLPMTVLQET